MKFKISLTYLTFLLCFVGYTQDYLEIELDSINTETQAINFIEHQKTIHGKLITFNKEKHHTKLADDLFKLGKGEKKVYESELEKTYYKNIDKTMVLHYRVSYIILDGNKKSLSDISSLRKDIISKYKQGVHFEDLAKQYSMDINAKRGGDSGWFSKGELVSEFEDQISNDQHKIGDIFTIDIPSKKWYYVILKTFDKMMIEEITVLKIVEPITR